MKPVRIVRKIRSVNVNGRGLRRIDITLPEEILQLAQVKPGDSVEISVAASKRITLMPLRTSWPDKCERLDGRCGRVKSHPGKCIPDEEVSF